LCWQGYDQPVACDLRTPRSTYDTFRRALLRGQPEALWKCVHPNLRYLMRRLYLREGPEVFFRRLRSLLAGPRGSPLLGAARPEGTDTLVCPLLLAGQRVGTACFVFAEGGWLLASLA
jgi:hypothetical protein